MDDFYITCQVQMKENLKGIHTYDIKKSIIKKHRNTIFKIREIRQNTISFYGLGEENELVKAMWNPEMFELVKQRGMNEYD